MSEANDVLKGRTKGFAHRCVKLAFSLPNDSLGRHLQNQLIRSSTSVAANYRAALLGQSKAAFKEKIASFWKR
ncbi:MAG: four helix bundle protein [Candidatus Marinimicrobia bacterium]|nr:four helix bundle protein [Candidatus Neomarinimicrobiota bacterium]